MSKSVSVHLKVFRFVGTEFRTARWLRFAYVIIAATSLADAKRGIKNAGIDSEDDWCTVKNGVDEFEVDLALANPGTPVWMDLDRMEDGWHVGGQDAIETYIRWKHDGSPGNTPSL